MIVLFYENNALFNLKEVIIIITGKGKNYMEIITNYNNSSSVAEANATTTYNEIKAYSEEERRIAIAILKGKLADYEVYKDLSRVFGWVVTIISSSVIETICDAVVTSFIVAALFGISCCLFKEKIRINKSLLVLIEESL